MRVKALEAVKIPGVGELIPGRKYELEDELVSQLIYQGIVVRVRDKLDTEDKQ